MALISMILFPSIFEGFSIQPLISFLTRSLVVFAGIYSIQESKRQFITGISLGIIVIIINSIGIFQHSVRIDFYLSFIIYIFFYCLIAYKLMTMLIRTERVNEGVLYAAINVYLLIGIIGGFIFMLIENSSPGSIHNLSIDKLDSTSNFFYFSFTTLSTLGLGDITPVSAAARAVAMLLSTTGPLYLTVLVALLVSRFESTERA